MNIAIYMIIIILFAVLLFWIWNNCKDFEDTTQKIKFIIIGLIILSIVTLILFNVSKIGVNYQNKDIMKAIGYSGESANALVSKMITNILESFKREGVINYSEFYEEQILNNGSSIPVPKKRLLKVVSSKAEMN